MDDLKEAPAAPYIFPIIVITFFIGLKCSMAAIGMQPPSPLLN